MNVLKSSCFTAFFLTLFLNPVAATEMQNCREVLKQLFHFNLRKNISTSMLNNKLMFSSGKILASYPGIEIESFIKNTDLNIYKKVAQLLAEKIRVFDQHLLDLGFRVHGTTRIVLLDKQPAHLQYTGAFFHDLILNWQQGLQAVVVVASLKPGVHGILLIMSKDASLFLHERAHNFLHHTYGQNSFISTTAIQEALADFLPSHTLGLLIQKKPVLKTNNKTATIIDLEKLKTGTIIQTQEQNFGTNAYIDSIYYSNALWETRQALGNESFSTWFKTFVDNLDLYRDSFVTLKQWELKTTNYQDRAKDELEYFLAVLKRTITDVKEKEDVTKVDRVIAKTADKLELDLNRIGHISQVLSKNEDGIHSYDHEAEMKRALINGVYIIHEHEFRFTLALLLAYFIYQEMNSENSN